MSTACRRATLLRVVLAPLLAVVLSNCAGPRAITGLGQQQIHIDNSATIPFLVATTRAPSGTLDPLYSNDRTLHASFSQIDVSVPASHKAGMVETTSNSPDPDRHFVATNYSQIADAGSFENVINARLAKRPLAQRRVFIFVHGFNNNFAEGLFRNAQMVHDYRLAALPIYFSWASTASLTGYAFDRDSALAARDGLAETIEAAARSKAEGIVIVGHSMGAFVVMEALRTLALRNKPSVLAKVRGVMLAAPDIDPDVFVSQANDMPVLPQPFTVVVSNRDRALRLSRLLTGGADRVGRGLDVGRHRSKEIQVIDVSKIDDGGHSTFAGSSTLIQFFNSDRILLELVTDQGTSKGERMLALGRSVLGNSALAIHFLAGN